MRFLAALCLSFGLLAANASAAPPPAAVRAVQVGAYKRAELDSSKQAEMETLTSRLSDKGFGPVWRQEDDKWVYVLVGRLERFPDALILKKQLRSSGFDGAYERAFPALVEGDFQSVVSSPVELALYPSEGAARSAEALGSNLPIGAAIRKHSSDLAQDRNSEAILSAQDEISKMSDSNPEKGFLQVELARALIQTDGSKAEPIPLLEPVAKGLVAAPRESQALARWYIADFYHEYRFQPLVAYQYYKEILEHEGATDMGVRARCSVEIAACLLELARSKQAYFNEVQRLCKQIEEDVPAKYRKARATSELIYWETFLFQDDLSTCKAGLSGFEERYSGCVREIMIANYTMAICLRGLGDADAATEFYAKNATMQVPDEDRLTWAGRDMDFKEQNIRHVLSYFRRQGKEADARDLEASYQAEIDDNRNISRRTRVMNHSFLERTEDK